MRIVFMGTAELAAPCLEAVAAMPGQAVVAVVTQPDRPKGRDLKPTPPPVKIVAQRLGIPVLQPEKIREPDAIEQLRAVRPDLIAVVAYGQLLPQAVLEIPPRGCINVHTSLLPRWRGASPIQHALLHGDRETGVTTMFINERMDAGDIILQRTEPIRAADTSATLHDRLATLGAALLVETIGMIAAGVSPRTPQDEAAVTLAKKLTKEDGHVDWTRPAEAIERQVRAFNPWPGAFTFAGQLLVKLWQVEVCAANGGQPGEVRGDCVATGDGALRLIEVQPAGGRRMAAAEFLRGHRLADGARLC